MKKVLKVILCTGLIATMLLCITSCSDGTVTPAQATTEQQDEVVLRIAGSWTNCRALEWAATEFNKANPGCNVVYEYLQGDFNGVALERATSEGDNRIDLFLLTKNIQSDHVLAGQTLDLNTMPELDLSGTFPSLIKNSMFIESDGSPATKLYSVPLGAQMRGLYVNVSLLKEAGIDKVPANQAELLDACAVLKAKGYVPFQGDPGMFAQQLLYPWICNIIANSGNYEETYNLVNTRDPSATELFRDVYEFLYTLVEKGYYDYNYSRTNFNVCVDTSTDGYARSLLNIIEVTDAQGAGTGEYVKGEGNGQVAFLPNTISLKNVIDDMKEDYHSDIEYAFIPAPVAEDGGFVYLSPAEAMAINKDSEKIDWAIKFLNFLFVPENNELFSEKFYSMPNTSDALEYISGLYNVPTDHISELGQATFDWKFYQALTGTASNDTKALPAISKANNPKYFDPETNKMYSFEHFWEQFQNEFVGNEEVTETTTVPATAQSTVQ